MYIFYLGFIICYWILNFLKLGVICEDDSYILETLQNVNKDLLLDRLIEEITFLKDEIMFLREDIKRKSDETTFLLNLLGEQGNNKNIKKLYRLPSTSTLNNVQITVN